MTAAVAGAGRAAAGRGAASAGAASAGGGGAARRPRARTIDERTARGGKRFRDRWDRPGAGDKKPARRQQRDYLDAPADADQRPAADDTPSSASEPTRPVQVNMPGPVSSGAGFILAVLFWSWVALPFLKNGPEGVRNTLKAKFLNKAADGSWLP